MSVPKEVTVATVEDELDGIKSYASRHGWDVSWNPEILRLTFEGIHPNDGMKVRIVANVDGYRALPPSWTFENPAESQPKQPFFPKAGTPKGGQGSIFHGSNTMCAPFNRLAYKQHGGPHGNWGGPECWLNVKGHIRETNLAGMFASIIVHLKASPGMK